MKLYVKGYSSYRSDRDDIDIKRELKSRYSQDVRRKDEFILNALFGAQRLKERFELLQDDELYITSGVGNINLLQHVRAYVYDNHEHLKPYDFINMLGNSTNYYVAQSLNIKGKSIFQISENFTYINSLISVYASLSSSHKNAILGCVDLATATKDLVSRVLGIDESVEVISSTNFQILSLKSEDALAEIEFDTKSYSYEEIKELLKATSLKISLSARCAVFDKSFDKPYFETEASFIVNEAIEKKVDTLHVECFDKRYKILTIKKVGSDD